MLKLLFFMAAVAHWITCLWHLLYVVLDKNKEDPWSFNQVGGVCGGVFVCVCVLGGRGASTGRSRSGRGEAAGGGRE